MALIQQCKKWLDENKNIAVFSFEEVFDDLNVRSMKYPGFELRPRAGEYKLNFQAAVWRIEELNRIMKGDLSPWELELYGNSRTFTTRKEYYSMISDHIRPINYGFKFEGMNVYRGKWVEESVRPMFDIHGISIDFALRGFYQPSLYENELSKVHAENTTMSNKLKNNVLAIKKHGLYWWVYEVMFKLRKAFDPKIRNAYRNEGYYTYQRDMTRQNSMAKH